MMLVPVEKELDMTMFVLVHGGFGSPAELTPVIPELEALGHGAIAVDLPCTDPGGHARRLRPRVV